MINRRVLLAGGAALGAHALSGDRLTAAKSKGPKRTKVQYAGVNRAATVGNDEYILGISFSIFADARPVDLVRLRRARRPITIMIPRKLYPIEVDHSFGKNRKRKQEFNYRGYRFRPGPRFAVKVPIKGKPRSPVRIRVWVYEPTEWGFDVLSDGTGVPGRWVWMDTDRVIDQSHDR